MNETTFKGALDFDSATFVHVQKVLKIVSYRLRHSSLKILALIFFSKCVFYSLLFIMGEQEQSDTHIEFSGSLTPLLEN